MIGEISWFIRPQGGFVGTVGVRWPEGGGIECRVVVDGPELTVAADWEARRELIGRLRDFADEILSCPDTTPQLTTFIPWKRYPEEDA